MEPGNLVPNASWSNDRARVYLALQSLSTGNYCLISNIEAGIIGVLSVNGLTSISSYDQ